MSAPAASTGPTPRTVPRIAALAAVTVLLVVPLGSGLLSPPPEPAPEMRDRDQALVDAATGTGSAGQDPVPRLVDAARDARRRPASDAWRAILGAGMQGPPDHPDAVAALDALIRDHGADGLAPSDAAAVHRLPDSVRTALARLVDAYRHYESVTTGLTVADGQASPLPASYRTARVRLLDAADRLRTTVRASGPTDLEIREPPVVAVDLGSSDDEYRADYLLQVDAFGADRYRNNAGGSGIRLPADVADGRGRDPCTLVEPNLIDALEDPDRAEVGFRAAAAAFDLAGDDRYVADRDCGVNGGGYLGSGLLVDAEGDDLYEADRSRPGTPVTAVAPASSSVAAADRLVVGFETAADLPADRLLGAPVVDRNPTLGFVVVRPDDPAEYTERARALAGVEYVEADREVRTLHVPDDPLYPDQYGPSAIDVPAAWDATLGDAGVAVCIVDTGLQVGHEDLADSRYLGGHDFVQDDPVPNDPHGHGTHVAGIAAATTDNAAGVAGVAQSGILAARVLDASGRGSFSDVASGIQWCADQGADVISMSLGGGPSRVKAEAVRYAWDRGSLLVAAAGNSGVWDSVGHPAAYPRVVAVTCTNEGDARCSFSSYGPEAEIAAPGRAILSTCTGEGLCERDSVRCTDRSERYCYLSGTSMSTPHVSGVAALVLSQHPDLTNAELRQVLRSTARDRGVAGCDAAYGYGIVDADDALAVGADPPAYTGHGTCRTGHRGANGGGHLGVGALLDLTGNDTYRAASGGVNGGTYAGSGLLVDTSGSDTYRGDLVGVHGGASLAGSAALVDLAGDDSYVAGGEGTQGGTHGAATGALVDALGDDVYDATSDGSNGGASGGVGALVDLAGDDVYRAGSDGANGGGRVGHGRLVDVAGNDRYDAGSHGTNGGAYGVHFHGAHFEFRTQPDPRDDEIARLGDSLFYSRASGLLWDGTGDDRYTAGSVATNGGGQADRDLDGDGRPCRATVCKAASTVLGLLVDVQGHDRYEGQWPGNGWDRTVLRKGWIGAQIDGTDGSPV